MKKKYINIFFLNIIKHVSSFVCYVSYVRCQVSGVIHYNCHKHHKQRLCKFLQFSGQFLGCCNFVISFIGKLKYGGKFGVIYSGMWYDASLALIK